MCIKAIEYHHKFQEGALPGVFYHFSEVTAPGANLYYTVYFLSTGLHAFHVIVGMSIRIGSWCGVLKGEFSSTNYVPVELGGLYWYLVDLVWISFSAALPDLAHRRLNVAHEPAQTEAGKAEHHAHGAGRYFVVWIVLSSSPALTVYTGHYHPNIYLRSIIAIVKASLVVLFFMHMTEAPGPTGWSSRCRWSSRW